MTQRHIRYLKGDLIKFALEGKFDIIVHGCNCQNKMGAGIAKQIRNMWPEVYRMDTKAAEKGDNYLGNISLYRFGLKDKDITIINAYTQLNYGPSATADHNAISLCFRKIFRSFCPDGTVVGIPKIGCGLGKLRWSYVRDLIETEMNICMDECKKDFTVICVEHE